MLDYDLESRGELSLYEFVYRSDVYKRQDFMRDFADRYGYDLVIENTAWDGLIPSLQTDKADCVISSMTITEERKEAVDFSDPYAMAQLAILANANSGVGSIDDLNQPDKKVAVKTGSTLSLIHI